jgi:hypothetical protein
MIRSSWALASSNSVMASDDGLIEVIVDDWSAMVKAALAEDPKVFYDGLSALLG